MARMKLLPRRGLVAALLPIALAGCVEPSQRSEIADTIDRVSFAAPPPLPGPAQPSGPAATPAREADLRPQVYPGRAPGAPATSPAAEAQRSTEGVQLNFDRAAIREVAKVILGDILGVAYTVDPDVQGEVTLSSSAPLSDRDLLAVLESVLRSNGASLVETGPRSYQILPVDAAIGRSQVVPMGGGAPIQLRPGFGITIVPLRHISATAAAQFIQPLVAAPEDIRIDPGRNAILFSGTAAERQNVLDTVADLDVDWMAGKSIGLFPLSTATAQAVIPELQAVFAPFDPTGAEPSLIRFMPVARLNAVLAIGGDPEQIREVGQWVQRLDRGETVGTQFYVYYLKHGSAEDVAKLLNETYADAGGGGGPSLASASTALSATAQPGGGTGGEDIGAGAGAPPLAGGAAGGAAPEPAAPSGPIKVVASKANNALLIRATPEIYQSIEATLLRLDTAPWQVLIEATIAEVALNDRLQYGVQAFFESGSFRAGYGTGVQVLSEAALNTLNPGFGFLFTPGSSRIALDALSRITNVKVLSSPSVVVQDNNEAVLTVGDEVPITTQNQQSITAADAPLVQSIEYRNTGVILQVRPRINSNQAVSLEIAQEVSRVVNVDNASDQQRLTPTITQRKITSRVSVQSGQTVVLGGLIQDSEELGRDRVPVIGEIPVLGSLFGSTRNVVTRNELIVFITPRVIRNPEDARDVSEELRSRLRSLSPGRSASPPMPNVLPRDEPPPPPPATPSPSPPRRLTPEISVVPRPRPPAG